AEGFEVMLDVVYNHTAEADHRGPTLSMRGIDNVAYYRLAEDRSRYVDLPAAATASMWITRTFFSSLWIACATGSWRCTSMDFDSISPARLPASVGKWIAWPRSSTSFTRIL